MRCQDFWTVILLVPTSLYSLYKCEHLPSQAARGPGWRDKNACPCQMGHVPGRPAWAGLEVGVGWIEK